MTSFGESQTSLSNTRSERMPENRRGFDRWCIYLPCFFQIDGHEQEGRIVDLSLGGAFIEAENCPPEKCELALRFSFGGTIRAQVRHSGWFLVGFKDGRGFGVQFDNLSEAETKFIRQLLYYSPRPSEPKVALDK